MKIKDTDGVLLFAIPVIVIISLNFARFTLPTQWKSLIEKWPLRLLLTQRLFVRASMQSKIPTTFYTRKRRSALPVLVIILSNLTLSTHPTHGNRKVRSSCKLWLKARTRCDYLYTAPFIFTIRKLFLCFSIMVQRIA